MNNVLQSDCFAHYRQHWRSKLLNHRANYPEVKSFAYLPMWLMPKGIEVKCADCCVSFAKTLLGGMGWGSRALGNLSILGDPRRADMKDIVNLKIKSRDFTLSLLQSATGDWLEEDYNAPFIMQIYQIRAAKRALIPAVTDVVSTCRLQTVYARTSPRYDLLINVSFEHAGVPIALNTSFNENEPVVCTPSEALDCFLWTKMDVLVMGDWVVRRTHCPT